MTIEQLKQVQRAQPFRPFDICLADGQRIRVASREFLYVLPNASRTFIVARSEEDFQILDLLLVTALDFPNGRARARRKRIGRG